MSTTYRCPGCGSEVLVPDGLLSSDPFSDSLGCNNVEEHDEGEALVMYPQDGNDES